MCTCPPVSLQGMTEFLSRQQSVYFAYGDKNFGLSTTCAANSVDKSLPPYPTILYVTPSDREVEFLHRVGDILKPVANTEIVFDITVSGSSPWLMKNVADKLERKVCLAGYLKEFFLYKGMCETCSRDYARRTLKSQVNRFL